jgi:hypothetical protein
LISRPYSTKLNNSSGIRLHSRTSLIRRLRHWRRSNRILLIQLHNCWLIPSMKRHLTNWWLIPSLIPSRLLILIQNW